MSVGTGVSVDRTTQIPGDSRHGLKAFEAMRDAAIDNILQDSARTCTQHFIADFNLRSGVAQHDASKAAIGNNQIRSAADQHGGDGEFSRYAKRIDEGAFLLRVEKDRCWAADAKSGVTRQWGIFESFGIWNGSQALVRRRKRTHCPDYRDLLCQILERGSGEAVDGPVIHWARAQAFVKGDRGRVPVEDSPFETGAAATQRELREVSQQCPADSLPARLRFDEKVFQIDTGTAGKRREICEENGKSDGIAVEPGEHNLGSRPGSEERFMHKSLIGNNFMRELFVLGELANEADDERHLLGPRGFDCEVLRGFGHAK